MIAAANSNKIHSLLVSIYVEMNQKELSVLVCRGAILLIFFVLIVISGHTGEPFMREKNLG